MKRNIGKKARDEKEIEKLRRKLAILQKSEKKLKLAQAGLNNTREIYQKLTIASPEAITITDLDGIITYASERTVEMHGGRDPEEFIGKNALELIAPEDRKRALTTLKRTVGEGYVNNIEYKFLKKDGKRFEAELSAAVLKDIRSKPIALLAVTRDISKSKKNEQALKFSEIKYKTIFDNANDAMVIHTINVRAGKPGKFIEVNNAACKQTGYSREELLGLDPDSLETPECSAANGEARKQIISSGHAIFNSCIVKKNGERMLCEISAHILEVGGFPALLSIIRDITERKKMEAELQTSYTAMKKVMDGIIHAMEKLVEKKDIYTVGHQHRTAQLAKAIAAQMGLPAEQINCVYISGLIHDIGKIFVSGSILNKKGTLTAEEYEVIKKHPEAGYEVLKTIDFPWPIADIILQHHERLDGSGYPYGLRGDRIYLESRIISVADVVEAITFERPYRPAFGIDKALEEIEKNRGGLYDIEVVDICVSLMKEEGFKFDK